MPAVNRDDHNIRILPDFPDLAVLLNGSIGATPALFPPAVPNSFSAKLIIATFNPLQSR